VINLLPKTAGQTEKGVGIDILKAIPLEQLLKMLSDGVSALYTNSRGDDALTRRYRAILQSWQPIALDVDIAESAARLRVSLRLRLADAVQAASALAINAAALVTHDRDFSRVHSLKVISWPAAAKLLPRRQGIR